MGNDRYALCLFNQNMSDHLAAAVEFHEDPPRVSFVAASIADETAARSNVVQLGCAQFLPEEFFHRFALRSSSTSL